MFVRFLLKLCPVDEQDFPQNLEYSLNSVSRRVPVVLEVHTGSSCMLPVVQFNQGLSWLPLIVNGHNVVAHAALRHSSTCRTSRDRTQCERLSIVYYTNLGR